MLLRSATLADGSVADVRICLSIIDAVAPSLAAQVGVDAAQAAEAPRARAHALEVGQRDRERVAHHHVLDASAAPEQHAHLPPALERELGELARELLRDQAIARELALVQVLEATELAGFQSVGLTVELGDLRSLQPTLRASSA